jgi:hypothetical protein
MGLTYDPEHPPSIVPAGESPTGQAQEQIYVEKSPSTEKIDEKNGDKLGEVEVIALEQESGDVIKESGLLFPRNLILTRNRNADNSIILDYTPEEYKKLLRKIDRYLLPLM